MVAKPEFLGHFIFNSDYPVDKVVWLYEGSYTSPSTDTLQNIYIPMGDLLGSNLTIFVKGAATYDNWATSIMIGALHSRAGENTSISMGWESTSGGRLHLTSDMRSHKSKTIKYRLWGVVRDDIQQAVDYPKNTSIGKTKLVLDTGLNYPRLYKDGVAMSGETIHHNLERIPYIDYWYLTKYPSTVTANGISRSWQYRPSGRFGASLPTLPTIWATNKTITFRQMVTADNETRDIYYYYRIYA